MTFKELKDSKKAQRGSIKKIFRIKCAEFQKIHSLDVCNVMQARKHFKNPRKVSTILLIH